MDLVFDIEADHYKLDVVSKIHCIVAQDVETEKFYVFDKDKLGDAIPFLMSANKLIGHNIIKYDLLCIQKFFPEFDWSHLTIRDTVIMSRLYRPKWYTHSLDRWGETLRFKKGSYAKDFKEKMGDAYEEGMEWRVYNDDMLRYCLQDCRVNRRVYLECLKGLAFFYNEESLELEQYTTDLMEKQKAVGVGFNREKATTLLLKLLDRRDELAEIIGKSFKGFYKPGKLFTPKRDNKARGYVKGSQMQKIIWTEFNPGSRDHIVYWFKKKYQWEPEEFTDGGKPKVSDDVLESLANIYPEAGPLAEYLMVEKRISAIQKGRGSWFNNLTPEGRIHGSVNPQGTITYRASHSNPNLGQIPKVGKPYGAECRELFSHGMGAGWKFMGCDMSGIEFRLLAHYLFRFDGGNLVNTVLNGDIHTENQKAAGLPTRDLAKTFIYCFIYGGGDFKLGSIVGKGREEGAKLRAQFLKGMPALAELIQRVTNYRKANKGYIRILDGRHIPVDHVHCTLNYLLQSAGAILSKAWMRRFHTICNQSGYVWGKDYMQLVWCHDEIQCAVREEIAEHVGKLAVKAIEDVGVEYKLNCPITGEYAIGDNWKETH